MTKEKIESIRERICDRYCRFPVITKYLNEICATCPLNELEADDE